VHEERTVDEMAAWIRAHKQEKFFAAYLTEFPHHPYVTMEAKPPFPDDTWLNRYKNSLHYADSAVGRLVDVLKSEGLLEKTVIAVVGDHGETVSHYPVGHGLRVGVEEMRPPLIISNPTLFPTPAQSRINSDHLDIAPTLVHMVGLTAPTEWLGRDLMAEKIAERLHFVTITQIARTAVIDGDLVYVLERESGKSSMFAMTDTDLLPLDATDPRASATAAAGYHHEAELFTGWAVWRHLARADALKSADNPTQTAAAAAAAAPPQPAPAKPAPEAIAPSSLAVQPSH
jgi:membrane-anchored protein YejM (alkaline phosphatase superfamily)